MVVLASEQADGSFPLNHTNLVSCYRRFIQLELLDTVRC